MDSIQDILQCKCCLSVFTDPVTLPCGESICEKHVDRLREANWKCQLCDGLHALALGERYPVNKTLAALLKANISKLDFGPIHKKANREVEAVEAKKREFTHAISEPKDFVATFTSKYRNQVDLAREEMVNIIDEACDSIKTELAQLETQSEERLRLGAPKMNELARTLDTKIISWKKNLKEMVVNESLWSEIAKEAKSYQKQLDDKIQEHVVIPPAFEHIKMQIERDACLKLSHRLGENIRPLVKISEMRNEKYVIVREVSKIAQAQSWPSIHSDTFDVRGNKFCLRVQFKRVDGKMYLGAYLDLTSDLLKERVTLKWGFFVFGKDFQIIGRDDIAPNEFSQKKKTWGCKQLINFTGIMAHPAYDAQQDMVRVEVMIE